MSGKVLKLKNEIRDYKDLISFLKEVVSEMETTQSVIVPVLRTPWRHESPIYKPMNVK